MSNEPVGVLIIGAGASGGAFAWSIADTGTSVLCLEQGPWMHQKDYPTNNLDWESRAMGPFASNPNVRGLPQDYPVNDSASPIQPLMFNAVGGSTVLWAAHFPRFTPGDFRVKSDDGSSGFAGIRTTRPTCPPTHRRGFHGQTPPCRTTR